MNFLIWRKNSFSCSRYFRFLSFCEIHKFQNLWRHLRHCYIMEVTLVLIFFFWILSTIKMKFGQILVCVWQTFLTCFWLNAGDWKLVPGPVIILLEWQYSKIWQFLIVDICHFSLSLLKFSKKWKTGILTIVYSVIRAGC